jgi:hydrolase, TatD family
VRAWSDEEKGMRDMQLFDTHAHYDNRAFRQDRHALLEELPHKGVGLVLCPGCDVKSSQESVKLADQYDYIYAAVGIHPHDAAGVPTGYLAALEALSFHPKVRALGEMGLDYHYDHSPRDVQRRVFREQMRLAEKLHMPVIVHDREAHADCLEIVKEFPAVTGVYHCYSGSAEEAKVLVKLGYHLSFTGAITFKNARRALEAIAAVPIERLMIETDAPYMTPEPHRGKRNDSSLVGLVAAKMAEVKGMSTDEVIRITYENGKRFFGIE